MGLVKEGGDESPMDVVLSCWEFEDDATNVNAVAGSCKGVPGVVRDFEELVGGEEADWSLVRVFEEEDRNVRVVANICVPRRSLL